MLSWLLLQNMLNQLFECLDVRNEPDRNGIPLIYLTFATNNDLTLSNAKARNFIPGHDFLMIGNTHAHFINTQCSLKNGKSGFISRNLRRARSGVKNMFNQASKHADVRKSR